jgi:hypothetical protein
VVSLVVVPLPILGLAGDEGGLVPQEGHAFGEEGEVEPADLGPEVEGHPGGAPLRDGVGVDQVPRQAARAAGVVVDRFVEGLQRESPEGAGRGPFAEQGPEVGPVGGGLEEVEGALAQLVGGPARQEVRSAQVSDFGVHPRAAHLAKDGAAFWGAPPAPVPAATPPSAAVLQNGRHCDYRGPAVCALTGF